MPYFVLFYDYVADMPEKRVPHREAHLKVVTGYHERGELLMAGAWAESPNGAAQIFRCEDKAAVEDFVKSDPYVVNGLVLSWQIRRWNVAVGG